MMGTFHAHDRDVADPSGHYSDGLPALRHGCRLVGEGLDLDLQHPSPGLAGPGWAAAVAMPPPAAPRRGTTFNLTQSGILFPRRPGWPGDARRAETQGAGRSTAPRGSASARKTSSTPARGARQAAGEEGSRRPYLWNCHRAGSTWREGEGRATRGGISGPRRPRVQNMPLAGRGTTPPPSSIHHTPFLPLSMPLP